MLNNTQTRVRVFLNVVHFMGAFNVVANRLTVLNCEHVTKQNLAFEELQWC